MKANRELQSLMRASYRKLTATSCSLMDPTEPFLRVRSKTETPLSPTARPRTRQSHLITQIGERNKGCKDWINAILFVGVSPANSRGSVESH